MVTSPHVVPPGNVQQLASWGREETGGDLFAIRVTDPDPSDWDACLARASAERGDDARPELGENVEDLDRYGTVFLGYPNWWYGVPMALLTFLEQNGLSGKEVYLFCSHGTGGLARSVELITEAETAANISGNIFDFYEEASGPGWRTWGMVRAPQGTRRQEPGGSRRNLTAGLLSIGRMTEPPQTPLWCSFPLTAEAEDYSTNEKIFYPPQCWTPQIPPWPREAPAPRPTTPLGETR